MICLRFYGFTTALLMNMNINLIEKFAYKIPEIPEIGVTFKQKFEKFHSLQLDFIAHDEQTNSPNICNTSIGIHYKTNWFS